MLTRWLAVVLFLSICVGLPVAASAYEKDVHFYLTYALCRLAGFSSQDAYLVARTDQSLDDNFSTTAFEFPRPPADWIAHGERWHALGDKHLVLGRFYALACAARVRWLKDRDQGVDIHCPLRDTSESNRTLVMLGELLHFYEDTYSHSIYGNGETTAAWTPYDSTFGHFWRGFQPDRVPNRRAVTKIMVSDVYDTLVRYAQANHRTPPHLAHAATLASDLESALYKSYIDLAKSYVPPPGFLPPNLPHNGPKPPAVFATYWGMADMAKVRCNLARALRDQDDELRTPEILIMGYARLLLNEDGTSVLPWTMSSTPPRESPPTDCESSMHPWGVWADAISENKYAMCGMDALRHFPAQPPTPFPCGLGADSLNAVSSLPAPAGTVLEGVKQFHAGYTEEEQHCRSNEAPLSDPNQSNAPCMTSVSVSPSLTSFRADVRSSVFPSPESPTATAGQLLTVTWHALDHFQVIADSLPAMTQVKIKLEVTISGRADNLCGQGANAVDALVEVTFAGPFLVGTSGGCDSVTHAYVWNAVPSPGSTSTAGHAENQSYVYVGESYQTLAITTIRLGIGGPLISPTGIPTERSCGISDFTVTTRITPITPGVTLKFDSGESHE